MCPSHVGALVLGILAFVALHVFTDDTFVAAALLVWISCFVNKVLRATNAGFFGCGASARWILTLLLCARHVSCEDCVWQCQDGSSCNPSQNNGCDCVQHNCPRPDFAYSKARSGGESTSFIIIPIVAAFVLLCCIGGYVWYNCCEWCDCQYEPTDSNFDVENATRVSSVPPAKAGAVVNAKHMLDWLPPDERHQSLEHHCSKCHKKHTHDSRSHDEIDCMAGQMLQSEKFSSLPSNAYEHTRGHTARKPHVDYEVGEVVFRKGKKAVVVKVDRSMHPVSYVVRMIQTGAEVNVEHGALQRFLVTASKKVSPPAASATSSVQHRMGTSAPQDEPGPQSNEKRTAEKLNFDRPDGARRKQSTNNSRSSSPRSQHSKSRDASRTDRPRRDQRHKHIAESSHSPHASNAISAAPRSSSPRQCDRQKVKDLVCESGLPASSAAGHSAPKNTVMDLFVSRVPAKTDGSSEVSTATGTSQGTKDGSKSFGTRSTSAPPGVRLPRTPSSCSSSVAATSDDRTLDSVLSSAGRSSLSAALQQLDAVAGVIALSSQISNQTS